MINLEQVEKLRQYGDISFEEAKAALEEAQGDLLEAVILLEQAGRIQKPQGANLGQADPSQSGPAQEGQARPGEEDPDPAQQADQGRVIFKVGQEEKTYDFSQQINRFFGWLGQLIDKGNKNHFRVKKGEEEIIVLPMTAAVLLLVLAFWLTLPLLALGLLTGHRYLITGPDLGAGAD